MTARLLSVTPASDEGPDVLMEIEWTPLPLARMFGFERKTIHYIGHCTVWHKHDPYNGLVRCGTPMECLLSDLWTSWKKGLLPK